LKRSVTPRTSAAPVSERVRFSRSKTLALDEAFAQKHASYAADGPARMRISKLTLDHLLGGSAAPSEGPSEDASLVRDDSDAS
jgi:hypothetical protein